MKNKKVILLVILSILFLGGCGFAKTNMKELQGKKGIFALIETNKGDILLDLFYQKTPLTVTNFIGLAEGTLDAHKGKHYYDGLTFHRVIADFMIQGGDPQGTGAGGPGYTFPDEFDSSLQHEVGTLSMANAGANTNGSQFFITHVPTPWLDGKHSVFGKVIKGQDVVNAIAQGDIIKKITIIRQGADAEAFEVSQKTFNERKAVALKNLEKQKEAEFAKIQKTIEQRLPNATKTAEGIFYTIDKKGSGNKAGKKVDVSVEYTGSFMDGQIFDSSKGREPLKFTTGVRKMIPGFDIMVQDMQEHEKRTFVIPPEYAYGEAGIPGAIPPNAYLVFEVELIRIF